MNGTTDKQCFHCWYSSICPFCTVVGLFAVVVVAVVAVVVAVAVVAVVVAVAVVLDGSNGSVIRTFTVVAQVIDKGVAVGYSGCHVAGVDEGIGDRDREVGDGGTV